MLNDKTVVIAGAGGGLGAAESLLFAKLGARLVLCDVGCDVEGEGRDPTVVEAIADQARALGAEVATSADDLTAEGAADSLVQLAIERFGAIDGLVYSAGIRRDRSLTKTRAGDLERMLDVHVRASFEMTRAAATAMIDSGKGGSIVLSSGTSAFFGAARKAMEAICAAAITGLIRSAAVELWRYGIRVNGIAPTARTRLTEESPLFRGISPRSMTPEHVAPLAAFLLSDASRDVHGDILGVAGGRIYALQGRETTGAFAADGSFAPEEILAAYAEITRGGAALT